MSDDKDDVEHDKDKKYRDFKAAREFVRQFNLKNKSEWAQWYKSKDRPSDIPTNPNRTYKYEWVGWGDFLGTGYIACSEREYRPFIEAREFVRSLGFKENKEWKSWSQSKDKPSDIPANVLSVYKHEWRGWSDFLGTDVVANKDRVFRTFIEARDFVSKLKLSGQEAWHSWCKNNNRPSDIPANPAKAYKNDWTTWGDFLGTNYIANTKRSFMSFNESREYMRNIGLKNNKEWRRWCLIGQKPLNIPTNPNRAYKDEWHGWGDFLGTDYISCSEREYRSFTEAREYTRGLKLKNQIEWSEWVKSLHRPSDIPASPYVVYKNEWKGVGDWLGVYNCWNTKAIKAFLESLLPIISTLSQAELLSIIKNKGLINITSRPNSNRNAALIDELMTIARTPNSSQLIESLSEKIFSEVKDDKHDYKQSNAQEPEVNLLATENSLHNNHANGLPQFKVIEILKNIDNVSELITGDQDTLDFLVVNGVNKIWMNFMAGNNTENSLHELSTYKGGEYGRILKEKFLCQYNEALNLEIPAGYAFSSDGVVINQPNLMQKFVACKIRDERRLGNWSGVGAGKTLSAILASRVIMADLTVIVALNATIKGWEREITNAFPDSLIFTRGTIDNIKATSGNKYLILNYEKFQQNDSHDLVNALVEHFKIDFIVLDEIQSAKQRGVIASKRREVLESLIFKARNKKADLCVLGVSATPVINNLHEAVSLLQMITGEKFEYLKTHPTICNCLEIHKKLVLHGVMYLPKYNISIETKEIEISGNHLLKDLQKINRRDILGMEKALLSEKLNSIKSEISTGTIIYTHYVTGIVSDIKKFLNQENFTYAEFTGESKDGLKLFLDKKVDILIGSSTIGTGLDGLQRVCSKMIIIGLPWTHAAYTQLLGRIYRQGSVYNKIQVIIPQIILQGNAMWSYDKYRMDIIKYKKTIGDAVLEGVFPDDKIPSPSVMFAQVVESLQEWIKLADQHEEHLII